MTYVARGIAQATLVEFLQAETDECLIWPHTTKTTDGYGRVKVDGAMAYVHVVVCLHRHGPRPSARHEVAHSCGRTACGNYRHLRWATHSENELDKRRHALV